MWNTLWTEYAQGRPNTYVFTKAMAEHYVQKHRILRANGCGEPVRTCIVRPAIVFNSDNEPTFGWIDSFNGPSGFSLFITLGLVRYTDMKLTNNVQLVPVDFLANFLLCLPRHLQSQPLPSDDAPPRVFTLTSSPYMNTSLYTLLTDGYKYVEKYPSMYVVRPIIVPPPSSSLSPMQFKLLSFIYHKLWSYCIDGLLIVTGYSNRLVSKI